MSDQAQVVGLRLKDLTNANTDLSNSEDKATQELSKWEVAERTHIGNLKADTIATAALTTAKKLLASAVMSVGVAFASLVFSKIIDGLKESCVTAKEAREAFNDLSTELSDARSNQGDFNSLTKELDALKQKTELTAEETERYYDIQNQLKDLVGLRKVCLRTRC